MCGRYSHLFTWKQLHRLMELTTWPEDDLAPRYNVAPTQHAPVVRVGMDGRGEGVVMRWGLIPSWADDPSIGNRLINARGETVDSKPSFRSAMRHRRCLVPASGFYEWQKLAGGKGKQPYYFRPRGAEIFTFAGLWERWQPSDGDAIESFTIITTEANELVRPIHDRMPVILSPEAWSAWLDASTEKDHLMGLLRPCDPSALEAVAVGTRVNSPAHDDPGCLEPLVL